MPGAAAHENSRSNTHVRHFAQGRYVAQGQSFQRKLESMPVLALTLKEDRFQLSLERLRKAGKSPSIPVNEGLKDNFDRSFILRTWR